MMQKEIGDDEVAWCGLRFHPVEPIDLPGVHVPRERIERRLGSLVKEPLLIDEDDA